MASRTRRFYPQADTRRTKWQAEWEREGAFVVPNPSPRTRDGQHTYVLEMLPYPSGELHMGHVLNYTLGDVVAHIRRRRGFTVLRPIGYDAFGLPAENAAIREGDHPRDVTNRNIAAIREQMKRLGWSIDWSRELSDRRARLLPLDAVALPQVLRGGPRLPQGRARQLVPQRPDRARERAGDRRPLRALRLGGRGAHPRAVVLPDHGVRRPAPRRDGAARVLARARPDHAAQLDRPLGGAEVVFRIEELDIDIPVFTTRPDTLFGATFFVLAPEHPLVERAVEGTPHEQEVMDYVTSRCRPLRLPSAPTPTRRRPASSPGASSRTRSTTTGFRSGSPTTS